MTTDHRYEDGSLYESAVPYDSYSHVLTGHGGTYAVSGQQATIRRGKRIVASGGTYAVSGQAVSIHRHRRLTASGGAYTRAGQPATIRRSYRLAASGGSYTQVGQSATLLRTRLLVASGGEYVLAGQSIVMTYSIMTTLSQEAIDAIAAAVWARTLPLGASPVITYGALGLSAGDMNAISQSVWSKSL